MRNVKVTKTDLIEKVQANKDKHEDTYRRALDGYKVKCREVLERHLKDVENGDVIDIRINLPKPVSYANEYERALEMLAMSVDDQIELSDSEFAQLVMDDWGWKDLFAASSAVYVAT